MRNCVFVSVEPHSWTILCAIDVLTFHPWIMAPFTLIQYLVGDIQCSCVCIVHSFILHSRTHPVHQRQLFSAFHDSDEMMDRLVLAPACRMLHAPTCIHNTHTHILHYIYTTHILHVAESISGTTSIGLSLNAPRPLPAQIHVGAPHLHSIIYSICL